MASFGGVFNKHVVSFRGVFNQSVVLFEGAFNYILLGMVRGLTPLREKTSQDDWK